MFMAASSCLVEAVYSGSYLALDSVEDKCKILGIVIKKKYGLKQVKNFPTKPTLLEILTKPKKGLFN